MAWASEAEVTAQLPDVATYTSGAAAGYVLEKIAEAEDEVKSYLGRYRDLFDTWGSAPPKKVKQAVVALAIHRITLRRARLMEDPDATPYERDRDDAIEWLTRVAKGTCELDVDWPNRVEQGGHVAVIARSERRL